MSRHVFSFVNQVALAASLTATSEDEDFPASNLRYPEAPFMPWKSTDTSMQTITIGFSGSISLVMIVLVNANFATVTIDGDPVTISRNPYNYRYQYGLYRPTAAGASCTIVIPNQVPLDGDSVFKLGGIWVGSVTTPPRNFRFDGRFDTILPREEVKSDHDGWVQTLLMGRARARLTMTRPARITKLSPGSGDHLEQWSVIDEQAFNRSFFAFYPDTGDPALALVVRTVGDVSWPRRRLNRIDSEMELEEVVAR